MAARSRVGAAVAHVLDGIGGLDVDDNLLCAGSVLVALPGPVVFFALRKQFVSGLTLGSTKG